MASLAFWVESLFFPLTALILNAGVRWLAGLPQKACPSASGGSISSGSIGELVIEQTSNISRNARPS